MGQKWGKCFLAVAFCAGGLASAAPGEAAPSDRERTAVLKALIECRALVDTAVRLACYDKAAADLDRAEAGGDIVVVDRQQAQAARREAFGFNFNALSVFDRASPDVDSLNAIVRSASQNTYGKWVIVLQDGATWRQIDTSELSRDPHPGSTAKITKGALSSFFMKLDGQPVIRVHRDQ